MQGDREASNTLLARRLANPPSSENGRRGNFEPASQVRADTPTPEAIAYEALTAARRRRVEMLRALRTR